MLVGFGGSAFAVLLFVVAAASDMPFLFIFAGIGMLVAIIAGVVMAKTMQPMKMDDNHAWFKVEPPFLNSVQGLGYGQQMQPPMGYGG